MHQVLKPPFLCLKNKKIRIFPENYSKHTRKKFQKTFYPFLAKKIRSNMKIRINIYKYYAISRFWDFFAINFLFDISDLQRKIFWRNSFLRKSFKLVLEKIGRTVRRSAEKNFCEIFLYIFLFTKYLKILYCLCTELCTWVLKVSK